MLLHARVALLHEFLSGGGDTGVIALGTLWCRGVGPIWELPEAVLPDPGRYADVAYVDSLLTRGGGGHGGCSGGGGGGSRAAAGAGVGAKQARLAGHGGDIGARGSWSGDEKTPLVADVRCEELYVSALAVTWASLPPALQVAARAQWALLASGLLQRGAASAFVPVRAPRRLEEGRAGVAQYGTRWVGWAVPLELLPAQWASDSSAGVSQPYVGSPPFSPAPLDYALGPHPASSRLTLAALSALDHAQEHGYCGYAFDTYSLGCVLYVLLSGTLLAGREGERLSERVRRVALQRVDFSAAAWGAVSPEARHLILCLTATAPGDRLSAFQALFHPWMQGRTLDVPAPSCYAYPKFAGLEGGEGGGAQPQRAAAAFPSPPPPQPQPPPPPPQQQQQQAQVFKRTTQFPAFPTPVAPPSAGSCGFATARLGSPPPAPTMPPPPPPPPAPTGAAVEALQRLGLAGEKEAAAVEGSAAEQWAVEDSFVAPPSSYALPTAASPPQPPRAGGKRGRGEVEGAAQQPHFPVNFLRR
jgi:hypothetical protein